MYFDLKRFRIELGLKQKDLADLLDIKQPYLSSLENGRDGIQYKYIAILIEKFGEETVNKYKIPNGISISNTGDGNISNTGRIGSISSTNTENDFLKQRLKALQENYDILQQSNKLLHEYIEQLKSVIKDKEEIIQSYKNSIL